MSDKKMFAGFLVIMAMISALWLLEDLGIGTKVVSQTNIVDGVKKTEIDGNDGGVILPVTWGNLGAQMVLDGVIEQNKFEAVYQNQGGISDEEKNLLTGSQNGRLTINKANAGYLLNLLWALGLGNKNEILEKGDMTNPQYGGAGNFASTAGWTIAVGDPMSHYSKHNLIVLTQEQQDLVYKVGSNIYRPCCGNSTCFPDCNHGMAMLGLLELMASQGVSEQDMYKFALAVNRLWFPGNYETIDAYLQSRGSSLDKADPKAILGADYSSIMGYKNIVSQMTVPKAGSGGGNCGV